MSAETSPVDPFDFDASPPLSIPVKYQGKNYVLREATAEASRIWRNTLLKMTKIGTDGAPKSLEGVADLETLLVSLCLFEVPTEAGGKEKPIAIQVLRTWPNPHVRKLFDKAKEMSGLIEIVDDREDKPRAVVSDGADTSTEESPARPPEPPRRRTMWG